MISLSVAKKQNLIYTALILITSVCTLILYHIVNQDWIIFHEAEVSYASKDFNKAIVLYNKSLAAGLPVTRVALNLANSYVTLGRFNEAIPVYKLYLSKNPTDPRARLELARALTWAGFLNEADKESQKLLDDNKEKK